ncbi:hypothetical protein PDENDC454_15272 [Paenibacillus dendritiformis C454]|uniref:Uncharacterized protein n=1 Tax=Paenibacillus dendritiformis C454 TaxID=1131935 RepID=H3SHN7_9BACL|nr:hypothetical protein [Paenibacillus dendritiformis]EHQ61429.1 hypothetical protein PDENDC454_15272 [Paenibacillus dendritiformis C454]
MKNFFRWLVKDGLIFLAIGAVTAGIVVVVRVLIKKKNARLMMEEKIRQAEKDTIKLAALRSGYLTAVDLTLYSDMTLKESELMLERLKSQGVCSLRVAGNGTFAYEFESILTYEEKRQSERV